MGLFGTGRALMSGPQEHYSRYVRSTNPIAYWPLWEHTGTVAEDIGPSGMDGLHIATVLDNVRNPMQSTCPQFVAASSSRVNLYSAALNAAFPGAEGSLMVWAKVSGAGVWTDATNRYVAHFYGAADIDTVKMYRNTANNTFQWRYRANNVVIDVYNQERSDIDWIQLGLTWSAASDQVIAYINGSPAFTPVTGLGAWTGAALDNRFTGLGASRFDIAGSLWDGWLCHAALWNRALNGREIEYLHDVARPDTAGVVIVGDSKSNGDAWVRTLFNALVAATGHPWETRPFYTYAVAGWTLADAEALITTNVATETCSAKYALINLGANDVSALPAEADWKADLVSSIDQMRVRWPGIKVYVARPWRRGFAAECNSLATWIAAVVATYSSNVYVGHDERVWLEGGDDGATMTSDGIHYSVAGQAECAAQWQTAMGL